MTDTLLTALRDAYREAGSLRALRDWMEARGVQEPFSTADWSRILRGEDRLDYPHAAQVARSTGVTLDVAPCLLEALSAGGNETPGCLAHRCARLLSDFGGEVDVFAYPQRKRYKSDAGGNMEAIRTAVKTSFDALMEETE